MQLKRQYCLRYNCAVVDLNKVVSKTSCQDFKKLMYLSVELKFQLMVISFYLKSFMHQK